jgi:hypothetical protein
LTILGAALLFPSDERTKISFPLDGEMKSFFKKSVKTPLVYSRRISGCELWLQNHKLYHK